MTRRIALACLVVGLASSPASAQTATPKHWSFVYGLSAGGGRRSASGTFMPPDLPAGAGRPDNGQSVAVIDIDLGVAPGRRVAILGLYEMGGARPAGGGRWGTLGLHGALRIWVAPRVWLEGGAGVSQLGYKPPAQISTTRSHWWAPGPEAAAGVDVFQGPTVAMSLLARYTTATFDGLRVSTFSVQVGLRGGR
jgi:hypothetical protein